MNLTNKQNAHGVKDSSNCYRNIAGVLYIGWTADTSEYEKEREKAKAEGLRTKIINGELFKEVRE